MQQLRDDREKRKKLNLLNYEAVLHIYFIGVVSLAIILVCCSLLAGYWIGLKLVNYPGLFNFGHQLKRELILVSVDVGTACSGYCLVVFSLQAALNALEVLLSLLYLQLLFRQEDTLSAERVPQIFHQKKLKKIGIRSEDLSDALERWTKGSGIALPLQDS
ncbi:hypothetical protein MLD38_040227 [Melastoma candidum]|uniref:Uncharacterized protein n=1 Tax=Melastoma candidum TaxID=119954 RepID=A0ACB9L5D1_9MYRT|nr:hypothetical protein MLD38_040227 [Melastoma candidum]